MWIPRSNRLATTVLVSWLVSLTPAFSQDQQTSELTPELGAETPFSENVDVVVVNVDVRVTDKDGNPIRGLTREDFTLLEDGKEVVISNFYAVEGGTKKVELVPSEAAEAEQTAVVVEEETGPLHLVVYVDNFNIRPYNRNRVFRYVREFLQTLLEPEDQVMLVSYDRTLHVQAPFNTDRSLLHAKLLELEKFTGHAVAADSDRRQVMRDIDEADSENLATISVQTYAESTLSDLRFTVRALQDFVSQLAGLRGRKAILHVSDGMPMRAAESAFYALQRKFSTTAVQLRALDYDLTREFRSLANSAASGGVAFYTLDAAGLRPYAAGSVQSMTTGQAGLGGFVDSVYIRNHQEPLRLLADQTGGFAILNTNNPGPGLERVRSDFDDYYSLGYMPASQVSGRGHRLKVEVEGHKKAVVRHRKSFREQTIAERTEDETLATLRFGLEENAFGASVQLAAMNPRDDGLFDVVAWLQVPVSSLTLLPREDFHQGQLTIYVSAMDEEGGVSDVANLDVPLELPNDKVEQLRELDFPYRLELRMRPGAHRVAIGIRDELGAKNSYVTHDFLVRGLG